ncbi:MAG: glycosyltransferase family 2 protein [Oscillospiraceae bacterium]|nr:glycosyltransferase family 2 protein [Candidatus Limivicinus sp.]MED9994283.1 glycosyltransferase family 2 protein [Oscillospiraceae bacterium]
MHTVEMINFIIMCLFFACYVYQFVYIPIAWLPRKKETLHAPMHRFAVLIAARNEEAVIGKLIDSIKAQSYPGRLVKIFVAADNCTDATAEAARSHGAEVYERYDMTRRGKGYALDFLLREIKLRGHGRFDGYIVLDADNVLDRDFILHMNETFSAGHDIVTCYRSSKNYGDNWISAGYALWFLRESRYLNSARARLGSSCGVSGTGFLFSQAVLDAQGGGWPFHLLTEDIEFTIDNVTRGMKVGYCPDAIAYDEQPISFRQSWAQRLRWSRGYLQVFKKYGRALISGIFSGSFSCYDMAMSIMPAAVLTGLSIVVNLGAALVNVLYYHEWGVLGVSALQTLVNLYLTLFIIGAITTATEWKSIHCEPAKKIFYVFTFPLFMLSYVPIVIHSLFVTPEWTHIDHTRTLDVQQICAGQYRDAV